MAYNGQADPFFTANGSYVGPVQTHSSVGAFASGAATGSMLATVRGHRTVAERTADARRFLFSKTLSTGLAFTGWAWGAGIAVWAFTSQ